MFSFLILWSLNQKSLYFLSFNGIGFTWEKCAPFFFYKEDSLSDFMFAFLHITFEKGATLIGKNLLPKGANSFLSE